MEKVLHHFGLKDEPFTISPDPRYLHLTPQHTQVLYQCQYTIENKGGLAVISGDIGTGKTTVARQIYHKYADRDGFKVAMITDPNVKTETAFLRAILAEYGVKPKRSHHDSMKAFRKFAIQQYKSGNNLVLFVDEAQLMTPQMIEVIRGFLNFESDSEKFIQVILFGQNELTELIDSMRAIKSRVNAFGHISPLDDSTIDKLIGYRWIAAGGTEPHPFTGDARREISKYSQGLPREIVKLCNIGLQRAFLVDGFKVTAPMIVQAAKELRLQEVN